MWNGVVTNLGLSLLEQWAAGSETLYIDKATAGSGTVAQSNMRGSTYVQGEVGDVSIVASIPVTGGTQYRIQVSANPNAAYIMHQIGIWAHLGASGGTTLLALYQDEDGVSVPLEADDPGFGFTLYAVVSMSNQGSVTVNFDGGAYVTRDDFSSALAGYVKTVNENAPNSDGNVTLPVDAVPTNGSTNPVSSDGVYDALAGKVSKAGDTMTGQLTLIGSSKVKLENSAYNTVPLSFADFQESVVGQLTYEMTNRRWRFVEYDDDGSNFEGYRLPTAEENLTANKYYDILTSKTFNPSAVGIVATETTAPQAITSGQYVIWQGSLYTAKSNIASGATLSTSNLAAVSNGGLNALLTVIQGIGPIAYHTSATSNTTVALTLPDNGRYFVCYIGSNVSTRSGMFFAISSSSGSTSVRELFTSSNVTVTSGETNNVITVTRDSGGMYFVAIPVRNDNGAILFS